MEYQIVMIFLSVMNEAMGIFQMEEAATSSSTLRPKHHRRYVNHDREETHFRQRHDYFNDDYVYPVIHPSEVLYVDDSFPKHYA
jgi:hypothetical protein